MEGENRHNCPVCGGCDFLKENGFFYCTECQTQCEGIREQVFEEQAGGNDDEDIVIGTPFVSKKTKNKKPKKKGEEFTSWEMLNFVLVGLTEELISYGAPKSIRDTILQLWASYLQKIEIAFFSKEENALPKLGVTYRSRDAMHLYGLQQKKPTKRTSLLNTSIYADLNSTIGDPEDWGSQRIQKTIKKKAKKAFMDKVAELSMAEYADNESTTSSLDQSRVFDVSAMDDSLSVSSMTLPAEDESVTQPKIVRSKEAMDYLSAESKIWGGVDMLNVSRIKLVILLYLALLYEGSTILLSDMLRWIREGHLSFYEAAKHLPDNCFVQGKYRSLFKLEHSAPTYEQVLISTRAMALYLGVSDWVLPDAAAIAKKYVKELHLPEVFSELVEHFLALLPMAYKKEVIAAKIKTNMNYEGTILAVIIIILKLLFGLDGKTEHQISKAASQLNILLKKKQNTGTNQLFVWKDWVQQLICRRAVLTMYHFPTKHLLCPEAYGNPYAYINYCHNWHEDNAGFAEKYNKDDEDTLKVLHPALLNTLTSVLEKLQNSASFKKDDIQFPLCNTPYSTYIKKILEKSAQRETPLIAKPALDVLNQDFTKCDITYLFQPKSLIKLARSHGQELKIKKKSAQKKFKKCTLKKQICIHQPNIKSSVYVSVTDCFRISAANLEKRKRNEEMKRSRAEEILKMNKKRMKNGRMAKKKKKGGKEKKSEKVKKSSKKRKDREAKKCKDKEPSLFGDRPRKRKEEMPTVNSKKMKLCKLLKLYEPSSKYWVLNFEKESFDDREFENCVLQKFPFSFLWLLSECSFLSEMSRMSLYKEVIRIEGVCYRKFIDC